MKEKLLEKLQTELALLEEQKDNDEYKNVLETLNAVQAANISFLEEIADKFTINGAEAYLSLWSNGKGIRRIYLNVRFKNGYRPNIKRNYVDF